MQNSHSVPSAETRHTYLYDAFISYRHVAPDRGWAKWLHGALETYRVPKQLVAKGYPRRLTRVFRDEEELPANADLSAQITAALDQSKFLIVVCSPRAVDSRWVNAEVEHFRKLGRHDRILALLIEGDPKTSFPKALVEIRKSVVYASPDGTTSMRDVIEDVEPLAADVRPERADQKAHALRSNARLRLMACILGCRFDDLRQREAERRGQLARRASAGLVALVLILSGLTVFAFVQRNEAMVQKHNAETQERIAKQRQTEAEEARADEKERAEQLKKVSDFQSGMLSQIDTRTAGEGLMTDVRERFATAIKMAGMPKAARTAQEKTLHDLLMRVNATDTAAAMIDRTILQPAIKTIDEHFKDDPKTDASLRQSLATLYGDRLALYDKAIPLQESALAKRRRVLGEEHPDTLISINNMGMLLQAQGKLAEAEPFCREALEISRRVLGEEHPDTLSTTNNMGFLLAAQGRIAEAEPYLREALEKIRRVLGEEHPNTLSSIGNMGCLLEAQGKLAEAESLYREALEKRRRFLGGEHPDTLISIDNMGALLESQGKLVEAEPFYREALEKRCRALGVEHPDTLASMNNVAGMLEAQGKLAEAEPYLGEALEKSRRVLGEEHPNTLRYIDNMGGLLEAQGKLTEAEPYYREALEKSRRVLGEEHPDTLASMNNVAGLLKAQGKLAEAEPYYREALEKSRRVLGAEHPETLTVMNNMGLLLLAQGEFAEAEPFCREALKKRRRVLGEEHPDTLNSLHTMGGLLEAQGKLAEAEPFYQESLEKSLHVLGKEHPDTLILIHSLGHLLLAQGKLAEAEPFCREAFEKRRRVLGDEHPDTLASMNNMGGLLEDQGKLAEAEPFYREALEKRRRVLGEESRNTLISVNSAGRLLYAQGKHHEAVDLLVSVQHAAREKFDGVYARRLADSLTVLGRARVGVGFNAERFTLAELNLLEAYPIYLAAKDRGPTHKDTLACVQGLVDLYSAWHTAEPDQGYDSKAAEWRVKLDPATAEHLKPLPRDQ